MIEESYVSLETAKLLKEAGFDVPCTSQYTENEFAWENLRKKDFNKNGYVFSRPTQALAARWLREVHGIHVWCELTQYVDWFYCIDRIHPYEQYETVSEADFKTYEQALEAGLQEAIKLIKK